MKESAQLIQRKPSRRDRPKRMQGRSSKTPKGSTKSRISSGPEMVLKCLLCSIPTYPKITNKTKRLRKKSEDEIRQRIRYLLFECFGISGHGVRLIDIDNPELVLNFCDQHTETVQKALGIHQLIEQLSIQLDGIKVNLKQDFLQSWTNDPDADLDSVFHENMRGYHHIRQAARESLTLDSNDLDFKPILSPESDEPGNGPEVNFSTEEIKIEFEEADDVGLDFCEIDPLGEDYVNSPLSPTNIGLSDDGSPHAVSPVTPESVGDDEMDNPDSDPDFRIEPDIDDRMFDTSNTDIEDEDNNMKPETDTESTQTEIRPKGLRPSKSGDATKKPKRPVKSRKSKVNRKPESSTKKRSKKVETRPHRCFICREVFPTQAERNAHRQAHGPDDRIQCELCPKEYRYSYGLKIHMLRAHSTERPFPCDKCRLKCATALELRKHMRNRHSEKSSQIFTCDICGKAYKGHLSLYSHVRVFHKLGGLPKKHLICEFCGKAYSNSDAFKEHKAKIHLSTYKPSVCDVCGKHLSDSRSLKKHKLSQHLKSFKHMCHICGAQCLYKSHLKAHMESSHSGLPGSNENGKTKRTRKSNTNTEQELNFSCLNTEIVGRQAEIPFQSSELPTSSPSLSGAFPVPSQIITPTIDTY